MKLKGSIVIAFSGRRYLMVRHRHRQWEFPGGRTEAGESALDTAKREFREETGLEGSGWRDCGIAELENGNLALFACRVSGRPEPDSDEIVDTRFFTAPPVNLSFARPEYFRLLAMAGWKPKPKTDYDVASREFDNMRANAPADAQYVQSMIRWGRIRPPCLVLDAGCGTGNHTTGISAACEAEIIGLDSSRGMLSVAKKKARGRWVRGDVLSLPFGDSAFDTAMMILVLQHVDDEPWAISEAYRVLRPGGRLLVATVSHSRIRKHIMRHFPGLVRIDLERFMPVPELKWHARNRGFANVRGHIMRTEPATTTVDALVERFRRRFISTLALVPDGDFEKSLELFERRVRAEYGDELQRELVVTFVEATKF